MIPARWILASASPRRRALIQLLGHPVEPMPVAVDEVPRPGEDPIACAVRLAEAKAQAAARHAPEALILAADTVVDLGGRILGKPRDAAEAREMLRALRNAPHWVHTALVVLPPPPGRRQVEVASTRVTMRPYRDEEIEAYIASGDPFDKAGAYAIQHSTFRPAAEVTGCYAAVVGLPLCHLARALRRLGWTPPADLPERCQEALRHSCTVYPEILAPDPRGIEPSPEAG